MLLVEATINATLHYLSMEGHALTHYWDAMITGFDAPQYQIAEDHGGYVRPGFGSIRFSHDLFGAADWPPPANITLGIYYSATTEAAKETIFTGTGHLARMDREEIEYELYGPSFTATVADATAFNDTLLNVATWFCGASYLNLTLDHTYDRASSPQVVFTSSGVQLAIDLFSEICAFHSHCFYISGTTLYLIDMLLDAGTQTITEFDFFPSEYEWNVPVSIARTDNYARTSAYPYGEEITLPTEYADTEARINTALDNIIAVRNKAKCRLRMPFLGSLPTPGKKISWTDTSLGESTDAYIRARTISFDFEEEEVIIEGEGELS